MLLEVLGSICDYVSTNFQLIIFYGGHTCGGFLITVISHVHLCFGCLFKIFLVYNYAVFPFDVCTCDACQIFALIVVL